MSSLTLSTYISPSAPWEFVYQQAAKHKSIHWLSRELILHIFSFLSPKDLGRTACVYREWEILANDKSLWNLKKLFPSLQVIDETVWETHVDLAALGLSIEDAPPIQKRDISILKTLIFLGVEDNAGITVLTMPKGLTLNKLVKLARSPKQGNRTNFNYISPRVLEELGDVFVEKTYRVAITNSVLQRSRNLFVRAQEKLVNSLYCELQMPEVLPVATLAILTYVSSQALPPTCLYGAGTYSRCSDQVDNCNIVVGGFALEGLNVTPSSNSFNFNSYGVGAMRKLSKPLDSNN